MFCDGVFMFARSLPLQELIVLRAIRDANVPKFLQDDLKLFNGIVSDLFPRIKEEPMDYGEMEASIKKTCIDKGLEDVEGVVLQCGQFTITKGLVCCDENGDGR